MKSSGCVVPWFRRTMFLFLVTAVVAICELSASAQVMTVKQLNAEKPRWTRMAADQKQVQFIGRYRSSGGSLQLDKFEVPCRLPSTIQLPERLPEGELMEMTGKFVQDNGRLSFLVSRIIYRGLASDELRQRAEALGKDKPDDLLKLAEQYLDQGQFYDDRKLLDEIGLVRRTAIETKRKQARGKLSELQDVHATAVALGVEPQFLRNLAFELLFTESTDPAAPLDRLLENVRKLEAWDRQVPPVPDDLKHRFDAEGPMLYDSGTEAQRELLHRQLYSSIRLRQIRSQLSEDGRNGLELADLVRREFSDQTDLCNRLEQREVDYRLSKVEKLNRQELQQLTTLLSRLKKDALIDGVLSKWLAAQETRFGSETLAGLLRTADEYLFVGETWKKTPQYDQGVELLKKSWAMASVQSPEDAKLIVDRLAALGWEQLGGRWMTKQQMQNIPRDDLQLAIREGRVVRGMTASQVTKFLGKPDRIARLGTSHSIAELWIYDAEGSAGMVVRFQKSEAMSSSRESLVEEVSRVNVTP